MNRFSAELSTIPFYGLVDVGVGLVLVTLAGLPATIAAGGTSFVTTARAATMLLSAMVIPGPMKASVQTCAVG